MFRGLFSWSVDFYQNEGTDGKLLIFLPDKFDIFFQSQELQPKNNSKHDQKQDFIQKELAILLGVNKRTLNRWLKPHRNELEKLGVKPCGQIFTPGAVKYLCEVFCISLD